MRDLKSQGGAAFPVPESFDAAGMSMRDYFAAQAMPVVFSKLSDGEVGRGTPKVVAKAAYAMADAMLAVRGDA